MKIGFIGCGNMASAMISGMLKKGLYKKDEIIVSNLTEEGRKLSQKYNEYYFGELVPYLSEISEEEADCMIRTIEKFYQIMCERRNHYDK